MKEMSDADRSLRTSAPWRVVGGFGRSVQTAARYVAPRSVEELAEVFAAAKREGLRVTMRGSGRSYGDAATGDTDALVVDGTGLRRVHSWDPIKGVFDADAGVTIEGMWRRTLEDGYWPHVVPGTMFPTLAGCVSMNIHGKNNFRAGPFGEHVLSLDLLTPSGELKTLGPDQEPELFDAVVSGAGMLGAITRVKVKLKPVESGLLRVNAFHAVNFDAMFDCFEANLASSDYLVGWVDCFASGKGLGRGEIHQANYLHAGEDPVGPEGFHIERQTLPGTIMGVPKSQLWRFMKPFMNNFWVRWVNLAKYQMAKFKHGATYLQSHVAFAFLLDYVPNWREAYGRHGFLQYQVFVPDNGGAARGVMRSILERCQRAGLPPYLGVFKRHRPDRFLLTHAVDGWSLAMDFLVNPARKEKLWKLLREISDDVVKAGGRFYFAKDSLITPEHVRGAWGDERIAKFRDIKRKLDPEGLFESDLARRVGLLEARAPRQLEAPRTAGGFAAPEESNGAHAEEGANGAGGDAEAKTLEEPARSEGAAANVEEGAASSASPAEGAT